jgi:hypothetical protein
MFIRRSSGKKEPTGLIKTTILSYIYTNKDGLTREDIADRIVEFSRKELKEPITQRSGIYRHLADLSKEHLIDEEKSKIPFTYGKLAPTLKNFKRLCTNFLKNESIQQFLQMPYFEFTFRIIFKDMAKENFGKDVPDIVEIQGYTREIDLLCSLIKMSATATRLLVLEPEKLSALTDMITRDGFTQEASDSPKFKTFPEDVRKKVLLINEFIDITLIPSVVACCYIDIFNELLNAPSAKVKSLQKKHKYLKLLQAKEYLNRMTLFRLNLEYMG